MLTLAQILEDNTDSLTPDAAYIRHAADCSGYFRRLLASDSLLLPDLMQSLHQPFLEQAMRGFLQEQTITDEPALKRALRKLRQRVMLRVIARDLNGLADLQEVMQSMSVLAEVAVQFALQHLTPWLEASFGSAIGEGGGRQELLVVGMGKLGGGELNVSSDIDLIFAYEEDGDTDGKIGGKKSISNHDFFIRLAKKLIAAIDEVTEDGFVFRVDMRLRPYGSEGPLACSFAMLEEYYQTQGREWERYAWIKGRVIAGEGDNLAQLLRPFVFRKYLDYGAFESMRDLKIKIHDDVNRKGMQDNIKLGRGGIREIEFIAQVFQLIRGGQDISLQIRPTLSVLPLLQAKQLIPEASVYELSSAYIFLRNLEHRLQYVEDAQTQELPTTDEAKARIALSMNYADWSALRAVLDQHRTRVEQHFSEVFSEPEKTETAHDIAKPVWQGSVDQQEAASYLQTLGYSQAEETLRRLQSQRDSSKYRQLPDLSRQRFDTLMPLLITLAAQEPQPEITLMRVSDLLDSICRRASYLALLAEYSDALNLVIKLASASPWLMQYLAQHPILLDELLDTRNLYAEPDFDAMREELNRRLHDVAGDTERLMDVMRHFKHAAVFRFAAQEIAGELPLVKLSDYLSALADLILQATIDTLWPTLRAKHREVPQFAVIGYGKLGGKELGYASDLDIIFLYDDDAPEAGEVYARLGQRINNWLSSLTGAGYLYETDMRLRPDGASGLLVSTVAAFREYQQNKAWVWEHQALTRARFCAGDAAIGAAFEQVRVDVMRQPRDAVKLREEVIHMRKKMHDGHANNSALFDLKHDSGGIVDVEFIVQYLVLLHAVDHVELTQNLGNIALLNILGELGLIDDNKAEAVAMAYRDFRHLQHAIRLQGEGKARVPFADIQVQIDAVQDLWNEVFKA